VQGSKPSFPSLARRSEKRSPSPPGLDIIPKDDRKDVMKKSVSEIVKPDWFSLDKYRVLNDMSAQEWAIQLKQRYLLHDGSIEDREMVYKNIISHPIIADVHPNNPGFGDGIENFGGWLYHENDLLDPHLRCTELFQKHVVPLTCNDVYWLAEDLPDSMNAMFGEGLDDGRFDSVPVDSFQQNQMDFFHGIVNLSVNLNVPDGLLVDEFKKYIDAAREVYKYPEGKKIKISILNRLIDSGILPYLDLSYWAKTKGINIPNHIIGDWLFPDDMIDVAEKIRKVTQPLARRSVDPGFIRTLAALKT
jgi:hypothetical protein